MVVTMILAKGTRHAEIWREATKQDACMHASLGLAGYGTDCRQHSIKVYGIP
jgi:hypothetical protein